MNILVDASNLNTAKIQVSVAEYTFSTILQHYILNYQGPMGDVTFCAPLTKLDNEADPTVEMLITVEWSSTNNPAPQSVEEARSLFSIFLTGIVQTVKSTFMDLQTSASKDYHRF